MEPSLRSPPPRLHPRATTPLRVRPPSRKRRRTALVSRLYRRTNTTSISDLQVQKMEWNHDITVDILSRLSVKSLTRFKCVCKDWQSTISSPLFFKAQLQKRGLKLTGFIVQDKDFSTNRYIPIEISGGKVQPMLFSLLPRDAVILASCNGLICYRNSSQDSHIYVCNPVNKQFIKLSTLGSSDFERSISIASDFDGSCIETFPKFKLVKLICAPGRIFTHVGFEVYSSETGAWRLLNDTCQIDPVLFINRGIYIKGVLYFLSYEKTIVAFDVEKERAGLISWPPRCRSSMSFCIIGESDGSLHFVLMTDEFGLHVWCLENYSHGKWTLKYRRSSDEIKGEYQCRFPNSSSLVPSLMVPLGFKDWVLLLKVRTDIILYDIKSNKMARAWSFQELNLCPLKTSVFPFHELGSTI